MPRCRNSILCPAALQQRPLSGFEVAFADQDGEQRLPLTEVWTVPFESCPPVRGFPFYKGQRNHVCRGWTATTRSLVGYESWLERDRLLLLDFDPEVAGIASQPFLAVLHHTGGQAELARAGLLRPPRRRLGAGLSSGGADQGQGRGRVRGDRGGLRGAGLALRGGRRAAGDAVGQRALAVGIPASAARSA